DPNSFAYLTNLRKNYSLDNLPVIFVATKSDLDYVEQRGEQPPDIYCRELKLTAPVYVSVKNGQIASVFQRMALLLSRPQAWSAAQIVGVTALAGL
ncbi:ERMES complex Ca(2+)-binding regulatory GTPase gem1, partial [Coemansia sp. RSA 2673]